MKEYIKGLAISDTHEQQAFLHGIDEVLATEKIDFIIHAGDGANHVHPAINSNPMIDCLTWLNSYGIPVIYSPGNHDTSIRKGLVTDENFPNVTIVIHDTIEFKGHKIFCSPYTPLYGNTQWAWQVEKSKLDRYWQQIPNDIDILVTHGPPKGILDKTSANHFLESCGCNALLNHVHRVEPKIHIFGHIHDEPKEFNFNHGVFKWNNTEFINASMVDLYKKTHNYPITFEI